jgi:hypothetical protein
MNPTTYRFDYNGKEVFAIRSIVQPCQIGDMVSLPRGESGHYDVAHVRRILLDSNELGVTIELS